MEYFWFPVSHFCMRKTWQNMSVTFTWFICFRFQRINTKYLKPILVRPSSQKMRGLSILNVYNKLTEKDAQDYLATHGSFLNTREKELSTTTSLYKYFRSQSAASLDVWVFIYFHRSSLPAKICIIAYGKPTFPPCSIYMSTIMSVLSFIKLVY